MAKVSGRVVAEAILRKLEKEIQTKNLKPSLAIILANNTEASRIYVRNKISLPFPEIKANFKSDFFDFSKTFSLDKYEKKEGF